MASERERADVAERRREWIQKRQPRMRETPGRLVFIDETSVTTKLTRMRGRASAGRRLPAAAPFGRWQTRPSSPACVAMGCALVVDGAMDREAFDI